MLRKVILTRFPTSDEGTFGQLIADSGWFCATGELPWRDNVPDISCILPGIYTCNYRWSEKHQRSVYHVDGVVGHTAIEVHSANLMGDPAKGYLKQLLGCVALGQAVSVFPAGTLPGQTKAQRGVTGSFDDVLAFEKEMAHQDFELWIRWAEGAEPCPASHAP